MDIALILVVICKSDIINRTQCNYNANRTQCNYMT